MPTPGDGSATEGAAVDAAAPGCSPFPFNLPYHNYLDPMIRSLHFPDDWSQFIQGFDSEFRIEFDVTTTTDNVGRQDHFRFEFHTRNQERFRLLAGDVLLALRGDIDEVETTATDRGERRTARVHFPRPPTDNPELAAMRARNDEARAAFVSNRAQRDEAARRRYAEEEDRRQAALTRARATLLQYLNDEQKRTFNNFNYIDCVGSEGTRYRIETDGSAVSNVWWLDDNGERKGQFCAAPEAYGGIPIFDLYFGQLLALITKELGFLDVAVRDLGDYPPAYYATRKRAREDRRRVPFGQ